MKRKAQNLERRNSTDKGKNEKEKERKKGSELVEGVTCQAELAADGSDNVGRRKEDILLRSTLGISPH